MMLELTPVQPHRPPQHVRAWRLDKLGNNQVRTAALQLQSLWTILTGLQPQSLWTIPTAAARSEGTTRSNQGAHSPCSEYGRA